MNPQRWAIIEALYNPLSEGSLVSARVIWWPHAPKTPHSETKLSRCLALPMHTCRSRLSVWN
jgi:hypothetical protein